MCIRFQLLNACILGYFVYYLGTPLWMSYVCAPLARVPALHACAHLGPLTDFDVVFVEMLVAAAGGGDGHLDGLQYVGVRPGLLELAPRNVGD